MRAAGDEAGLAASEEIGWDCERMPHSARGHPLAPLPEQLAKQRLPNAETVRAMKPGVCAHFAAR
jgi:hypothetical protein